MACSYALGPLCTSYRNPFACTLHRWGREGALQATDMSEFYYILEVYLFIIIAPTFLNPLPEHTFAQTHDSQYLYIQSQVSFQPLERIVSASAPHQSSSGGQLGKVTRSQIFQDMPDQFKI